jgi:NAD+ synthase (glutamine-hydrolysing)
MKGSFYMKNYGYIKAAVASPKLKVANPDYNSAEIFKLIEEANNRRSALIVFPELSITGYTCGDLFNQKSLLKGSLRALANLIENTSNMNILTLIGMPLYINDGLYNCAVAIQRGKIIGVVPKMFIPNYKEFYEKRWFTSGHEISKRLTQIKLLDSMVPFGNIIFKANNLDFSLGIEICEDVWTTIPPSSYMVLNGANLIANLSASNELVAKSDYRKQLVLQQSARGVCAYLYSSSGVHESTTDLVFSGDSFICENGAMLKSNKRFSRDSELVYSDIDIDRLNSERQLDKSFADSINITNSFLNYQYVDLQYENDFYEITKGNFDRKIDKNPFVPNNPSSKNERCEEIFSIQVAGLAKRMEHTNSKYAVIGISGGLDSTLALLVIKSVYDLLKIPSKNIIAITMPGFGTTDKTYDNAINLMKTLKVTIKEVNIKEACLLHFKDIDHDLQVHDITYENTQARERTQILMDYANKIGGLVIGTGDLSELALGWCTYNGDHMSMYAVNTSIPKTLVQHLIRWYMDTENGIEVKATLQEILDTPISPELLPPDKNGNIKQKTESVIGPYELHDFFLYHIVRFGTEPKKVLFLAEIAFESIYTRDEIKNWLTIFYKRFFTQQFKRSCIPDGPKVGSVSLSPRGDWRMPSDADGSLWIKELEFL